MILFLLLGKSPATIKLACRQKHASIRTSRSTVPISSCRPRYILNNLKQTFEAAGSSLDNVVKAQVFMTDLRNFAAFDEIWKEFFKVPPPRTTVGTSGLLVKDSLVEIDLIATR